MIWHFFEVWVLMLAAFAIGCPLGALAYKAIAESPLADLQGDFADVVGDLVDGIKGRLGIGPVWRPEYRRLVERHGADHMGDRGGLPVEGAGDRLPAGGSMPLIADQSGRDDGEGDRAAAAAPAPAAPGEAGEMARPMALAGPRNGVPDDLQRIRGVGRRIEQRLNGLGIFHFGQIAAWTPAEMRWVAQQLAFPERIEWDDWIGQAIILAAGGDTGFVKSADRRRARRRQRALEAAIERATEEDDTAEREVAAAPGEESPGEEATFAGEMTSEEAAAAEEAEPPEEDGPLEEEETSEDGEQDAPEEEEAPEEENAPEEEDASEEEDAPKEDGRAEGEGKTA